MISELRNILKQFWHDHFYYFLIPLFSNNYLHSTLLKHFQLKSNMKITFGNSGVKK